jgi:hypothetical protein
MQLLSAYLIFLLAFAALGLGLILCGAFGIALYEGAAWLRSTRPFFAGAPVGNRKNVHEITT